MDHLPQTDITRILSQLQAGAPQHRQATEQVFELAYDELRRLAAGLMARERSDHTLRPTALVHEAFLRLVRGAEVRWENRAHFLGIAARAMRQILVEHARARLAAKREGGWDKMSLDSAPPLTVTPDVDLVRFEAILTDLATKDARVGKIVELRVFGGLTVEETAHVLGVSPRTVDNDWKVAKMWITRALTEDAS